jgi:hypothetical protein
MHYTQCVDLLYTHAEFGDRGPRQPRERSAQKRSGRVRIPGHAANLDAASIMHYVFCWGLTAESWVLATGVGLSP